MKNIVLVLEYDGSQFHGWQSQANADSVQSAVAAAICRLDGAPRNLIGAGRTDAGVHARGQVANFFTDSRIPPEKYAYALNTILPQGVACVRSAEAPPEFHARFSAKSKAYSYLLLNRRQPSALYRDRAWHIPLPLDVGAMRTAALRLIGEWDFRAFMSSGSPVRSTIRKIISIGIDAYPICMQDNELFFPGQTYNPEESGVFVKLMIEGNGFLYNMVRIIAGTLVYIGHGKMDASDIGRALTTGDRRAAGKTAPPQGLCLEYVRY